MARKRDPEREAQRRAVILLAAARAFVRDGLRGTSIAAICKEAGISPGLLYYYFPSKEALIEAMAEADLAAIRGFAERLVTLDDLLDAAVSSSEFMSFTFNESSNLLGGALAFDLHAEATRNPRVHAIMERHYHQISALFGERLAAAQKSGGVSLAHDPVKLARLVGAVREGLLMMSAMGPDVVDADMRATARRMLETAVRS
jgi:AcrR family transcriptional regulator